MLWGGVALGIIFGYIHASDILSDINWNVMGIFAGTLILSEFFILSHVPDAISTVLVRRTRTVGAAYLAVCIFSSVLSVAIENVATVLIIAPIMIGLAKKIGVSPVPGIIGIAIASNLQGTATLIGDPPSMILANYMRMTFNDFFVYHGNAGIFFAVQVGAVGSMLFLYWYYSRYKTPIDYEGRIDIRSFVPSIFIGVMIVALTLSTFVDPDFKWFGGFICMFLALLCVVFSSRFTTTNERRWVAVHFDWGTTAFLAGIFVMVGMLERTGVIEMFANFLAQNIGDSPFVAFSVVVWVSVAFSAIIDNVPYLTAMIPVVQLVSDSLGVNVELLVFGLLIGASLGGNITPVGAAANIVGVGTLRKHGYHVSFGEFMKIGLPFTVIATAMGSLFVYFVWK
ncbi:MAG: TRAP transporter large permease subunit [Candidatus Latescibacterota bacterium]|nr:MAG: TRAP transporter large permease subunit [Candidatus Latescibacterota bacterium]